MTTRTLDEVAADRARRRLNRPGAFIEEVAGGYALRAAADRRRPPVLALDEEVFRALVEEPGLKPRAQGGWVAAAAWREPVGVHTDVPATAPQGQDDPPPPTGARHRAATSLIVWLATRIAPDGRPWLTRTQAAAAQQLMHDYEIGQRTGRVTVDWSFAPRSAGGFAQARDPAAAPLAARRRLADAMAALDPPSRGIVERVCLRDETLRQAEVSLGLAARSARLQLQIALDRLAAHYGLTA